MRVAVFGDVHAHADALEAVMAAAVDADVQELWSTSLYAARDAGLVESGDRVVITAGTAVNIPGSTNVIKVDTVP